MTLPPPRFSSAMYEAAAQACLAACTKWHHEHPGVRLKFKPPSGSPGYVLSFDLGDAVKHLGIAGNGLTRQLLMAMYRATPYGGATVLMAEYAIGEVFGIKNAITQKPD